MALSLQCMVVRCFARRASSSPISLLYNENTFNSHCRSGTLQRLLSSKPNTSTPASPNPSSPSVDKKNFFVTIYKMPYIRHLAVIQKVKVQQTILTLIATPVASVLAYTGYLPPGTGWGVGYIGFLICTLFYSLGFFGANVVGYVYVSIDNSTVRISYVDSWGCRRDDDFPVEDLVPLSELPRSFYAPLYYKLQRYSKQKKGGLYRLNLSEAAQITDQDRFTNLFGKVDM